MHIITPYDPWTPKKKQTWQEKLWEEQQIAEIEARILSEVQFSKTLPDNAPAMAQATAGGMAGMMAGGGGSPPPAFFHAEWDVVSFDRSPTTGAGPLTVQFTNLTTTPQFDSYLWEFIQDGVTTTSTNVNPLVVFQTGSENPSKITASLQASSSATGKPGGRSSYVYTNATYPTVTAAFTLTTSSVSASSIATFTNTTVNTSQTPSTTYLWTFGSGSLTSALASPAPITYTVAGPYTASLQATGSYNLTSFVTRSFRLG